MTVGTLDERHLAIGREFDKLMALGSLERCNCMVRYNGGPQMPAIRHGKHFTDPEGREIARPTSFEDMKGPAIIAAMTARGEVYIGHMFEEMKPA